MSMAIRKKSMITVACDKWLGQRTERGISVGQIWDGAWETAMKDAEHRVKCLPIFGDGKVLLSDVLGEIDAIRKGKHHA